MEVPSSSSPPHTSGPTCSTMPSAFALRPELLSASSNNGTVVATFANAGVADFALNWARLLGGLGLKSIVGMAARLGASVEAGVEAAGGRLFCADGPLMQANGQAGRWAEVGPVLRLAAAAGLSVLLSDVDIAWMRDPRPYFEAAKLAHPALDFLLLTDKAVNGLSSTPLPVQPREEAAAAGATGASSPPRRRRGGSGGVGAGGEAAAGSGVDLELENAYEASISYNIGVIYFFAHAMPTLDEMVAEWVGAVGGPPAAERRRAKDLPPLGRAKPAPVPPRAGVKGRRPDEGEAARLQRMVSAAGAAAKAGRRLSPSMLGGDGAAGGGGWRRRWEDARLEAQRPSWYVDEAVGSSGFANAAPDDGPMGADGGAFGEGGLRRLAAGKPRLSEWDQEPINKRVLQLGLRPHGGDGRLAYVWSGRLVMGVLPMLQFTTAFTYYMHRTRREHLEARPYCLHAIFAHGKDPKRKRAIFREERLWVDPPEYYAPSGRYLAFDTSVPASARSQGGWEMITSQLRQVHHAVRLAAALNRTLILPRIRCGERTMAYPCYAWYHRAMAYFGFNFDKVPMPDVCPTYYWLEVEKLGRLPVQTREPSFLENTRTPHAVLRGAATLRLCPDGAAAGRAGCSAAAGGGGGGGGASRDVGTAVELPGSVPLDVLMGALRHTASAPLLRVEHVQWLSVPTKEAYGSASGAAAEGRPATKGAVALAAGKAAAALGLSRAGGAAGDAKPRAGPKLLLGTKLVSELTRGVWCTGCAVTRRGAVIGEVNRSVVRELEAFCKTEARVALGLSNQPSRACCSSHGACRDCAPHSKPTKDAKHLPWHVGAWLPVWAALELGPRSRGPAGAEAWPRCTHPLCTGSDRKKWP